ncbi:MAG: helicase IV, partial [Methylobacter sp.]|nr:helicase IV [Methylobacter sp.]
MFASDYQSLSLADDGIVLAGRESIRIPYLEISLGTTVEQGFFWNALLIPLENGDKLRFSGVAKKKSESLQETINHQCRNYIKAYYQRIVPDLQQANQQARVTFSGYIRHAAAQQWFANHQHLAKGIKRQDIDDFLPPESLKYVKALKPLLTQGYIDKRNKAYVRQQLATFQAFFDQVESNPLTANQRKAC